MIEPVQALSIAVSLMLLLFVLDLVRRKRLTEEYSFVWIVCALALLGLSVGRSLLDTVALALGIYYPPAALLLVLILFVFVASLSFSVVISRQRQQIERLMEDVAILDAHVRELSAARGPASNPQARDDQRFSASHTNSPG
jgi:hypothetical protein